MLCLISPESRAPNDHPLRRIMRLGTRRRRICRQRSTICMRSGASSGPPDRPWRHAARTTRSLGYKTSRRIWKRIEDIFGWRKETGGLSPMPILNADKLVPRGKLPGSPSEARLLEPVGRSGKRVKAPDFIETHSQRFGVLPD